MNIGRWIQIAAQFAPQVLLFTPLAPIAGIVSQAIQEAEQIKGATGPQKLAHVTNIAIDAAAATNAKVGRMVIDPNAVRVASASAISTVVTIINGIDHAAVPPVAAQGNGPT